MRRLNLDKLNEGINGISPVKGACLREAILVGLTKHGFTSGVKLNVYGEVNEEFILEWNGEVTDTMLKSWNDEYQIAHQGSVGITVLLMSELFGFKSFEESLVGTGIDFWIRKGEIEKDWITFTEKKARLEISGIFTEKIGNTVNMRIGKKKKQVTRSDDSKLPVWIAIVEFSTPKSKIIRK